MDWLASLQTFGTSFVYPALKLLLRLCYLVTIPLHYPIYYLFALVAFLLSPIWYMLRATSSAAMAVVDLVTRLKYLYIYLACAAIVGIFAGCALHGTSSFIFLSLGVDSSQKRNSGGRGSKRPSIDDELEYDELESTTWSEGTSARLSASGLASRWGIPKQEVRDDTQEMFEKQWKQWKQLRSPEKPKRRRRGLLSQTIHEESSSDFSQ
ncbi:hypothetical protein F5Y05DRAFT_382988 [Hypoxylon sp. FL0543]|nr:hypothetical protein F5Y05DRAFT_382988 [Hypoxylon sp. FL0543]